MRKTRIGYVLGILLCLWGALLMVAGEPLLGEYHTGIATVVGIVGIGLIAEYSTKPKLRNAKTKSWEEGRVERVEGDETREVIS